MYRAFAAFLLCALAPAADAKCAMMGLEPSVITVSGATIAPDGGILVGAIDAQGGATDPGDAASQAGWRLKLSTRAVQPTLVPLAPGLVLYKLPTDAKGADLIDDKRASVGSVVIGPKIPLLAAPKLRRITYDSGLGRRPFAVVSIELDGAAPAGAVAIVIADAVGKARSWGRIEAGKTTQRGYDRSRCRVLANGTVESKTGERVTVFYVDASGRKSAASKAFTIAALHPGGPVDDGD